MADTRLSDQPGTVQAAMNVGDRVVVKSGPWPERIGSHGVIVTGKDTYPFHSTARHECVILLDRDPLRSDADEAHPFRATAAENERWSCVIECRDLTAELW